jgi:hypothetical protein
LWAAKSTHFFVHFQYLLDNFRLLIEAGAKAAWEDYEAVNI